jgi:hypothetical protein
MAVFLLQRLYKARELFSNDKLMLARIHSTPVNVDMQEEIEM